MLRIAIILAALGIAVASGNPAAASIYNWNPVHRPPVTLPEALAKSKAVLGTQADGLHCMPSVWLAGDEANSGKRGLWSLRFYNADGFAHTVSVDMSGRAWVEQPAPRAAQTDPNAVGGWLAHEPPPKPHFRDLADVEKAIREELTEDEIDAQVVAGPNRLVVQHRVRKYQVYPAAIPGEFNARLEEQIGPLRDGFYLQVESSKIPARPRPMRGIRAAAGNDTGMPINRRSTCPRPASLPPWRCGFRSMETLAARKSSLPFNGI